jgi:hypothetical protein
MLRVTKGKSETKKRSRFTGICADAQALGVSREHLFRVLTGERQSRSLMRRYLELKRPAPAKPAAERERHGVRTAPIPGGDGINDGIGAAAVCMGPERAGRASPRRARP